MRKSLFKHLTTEEIEAGLENVLSSPADSAVVEAIVRRPAAGQRDELTSCELTVTGGLIGDHWAKGAWKSLPDGSPDPDVQISLMNRRFLDLIATSKANWAPAGNNFIVDMDLSAENLAVGQRLSLGAAEIEISPVPNTGCKFFIERYGRDACVFVNRGIGRDRRLRGVYARVVKDGLVSVGDKLRKLDPHE